MYELVKLEGRKKVVFQGATTGMCADFLIESGEIAIEDRSKVIKSISRVVNPKHGAKSFLDKRYTVNEVEGSSNNDTTKEELYLMFSRLNEAEAELYDNRVTADASEANAFFLGKEVTKEWSEVLSKKFELTAELIPSHIGGDVISFKEVVEHSSRRYLIADRSLYRKKRIGDNVVYTLTPLFKKSNSIRFSIPIKHIPEESNCFSLAFWPEDNYIDFSPELRMNGKGIKTFDPYELVFVEQEKEYEMITRGKVDSLEKRVAKLETNNERLERRVALLEKENSELLDFKEFLIYLKGKDLEATTRNWRQYKEVKEM